MAFSGGLFERVANGPVVPDGLPLVVLLTGFTDAGSAVSGLIDHLHETAHPQTLVQFDNDQLLDYRARRPVISFDQDHLTEFRPARLELTLMADALGQPFLLLSGYEPDFAWNAFTDSVLALIEEFAAASVSWVHSIAMPVPHTRAVQTTVSGTRADLIAAHSVWRPRTQVPATAGHLLEYRLSQQNARVVGFVLLIPHYLADTEHPGAVLTAADRLMMATGLVLSMDTVRELEAAFIARVEEQVEANDELRQMVNTLEQRHDSYMAGLHTDPVADFDEGSLPSADELAAELERYLASRHGEDDKPGRG